MRLHCCPLLATWQHFKWRLEEHEGGSCALVNLYFDSHRSNWLKPCCGRRVALWQVCLLSTGFNCVLVSCVILVVLFLSLELLIDTKLLQCKYSIGSFWNFFLNRGNSSNIQYYSYKNSLCIKRKKLFLINSCFSD